MKRIFIYNEKFYDVSTDEQLWEVSYWLFRARYEQGTYNYYPEKPTKPMIPLSDAGKYDVEIKKGIENCWESFHKKTKKFAREVELVGLIDMALQSKGKDDSAYQFLVEVEGVDEDKGRSKYPYAMEIRDITPVIEIHREGEVKDPKMVTEGFVL